MLRQGPISLLLHGLLEYGAGALLVAAPFLLSFKSGAATAVAIVAGVLVIVVAATTVGRTSLVDSLPLAAQEIVRLLAEESELTGSGLAALSRIVLQAIPADSGIQFKDFKARSMPW